MSMYLQSPGRQNTWALNNVRLSPACIWTCNHIYISSTLPPTTPQLSLLCYASILKPRRFSHIKPYWQISSYNYTIIHTYMHIQLWESTGVCVHSERREGAGERRCSCSCECALPYRLSVLMTSALYVNSPYPELTCIQADTLQKCHCCSNKDFVI